MVLSEEKIIDLQQKANSIRESLIEMLLEAGSGHTAGPLGMADIFAVLFFHSLNINPRDPQWEDRDRLILSNGHICPVLYATMSHAGFFPKEELKTLRKFNSRLQGHPHKEWLPGLETSSGPLGSGLSQAVGMALANRMDEQASEKFFYCLLGDGELDEGQNWEAIMLGAKEKLANVIAIIDRNKIQLDGFTEDIMPLESLHAKWKSFGWNVIEIDGHDIPQIVDGIDEAKVHKDGPTVIIAHTIPGKGVPVFEKKFEWHGKVPNKEEAEMALKALHTLDGRIVSEHESHRE